MVLTRENHVGRSGHGFLAWTTQPYATYSVWPLIALFPPILSLLYSPNFQIPS